MGRFLDQFTGEDLFIGGFALVIILGALGVISNALLRGSGFGVVVNGCLLLAGGIAGISARGMLAGLQ